MNHKKELLRGLWVVVCSILSRATILTTHNRGLIAPFITTHEPPTASSHGGKKSTDINMEVLAGCSGERRRKLFWEGRVGHDLGLGFQV